MTEAPNLLNDDGSASIATALLMSHHGLRRDLARFRRALQNVANGDSSRVEALREEWQGYRETLHGHHEAEDTGLFPHILSEHASLGPVIEQLTAEHRLIDPLLERGDRAFSELPDTKAATGVIDELKALLDAHLMREEAEALPFLRDLKEFPPPDAAVLEMYAQGFAWSSHGVAPEVLERVYAMLPESLTARLPAARAAFDARCERVWGSARAGASRTALPDASE